MLVAAVLATAHLDRRGWIPQGPGEAELGYSGGDDWDARMHTAMLGIAGARRGTLVHWDPYSAFGAPAIANPESFLLHPAWIVGTASGTWYSGLSALYLTSLGLLILGGVLLARRLGLPALVGLLAPLFVVVSMEWVARLGSGHLFVLGVGAWPVAIAAADAAMEPGRGRWSRMGLAALGGAVLGVGLLFGGHYILPMGVVLAFLVVWGSDQPPIRVAALAALLLVPLLGRGAHPIGRPILEAALVGVLLWGMARRPLDRVEAAVGVGVGTVAGAGAMLVVAARAFSQQGRLAWGAPASTKDLLEGTPFWADQQPALEQIVHLPSLAWWVVVAVGVAGLLARKPAIGLVVLAGAAAALTQGSPWKPWRLWAGLPGTSALTEQARWSWVLLVMAVLGVPALAASLAERWVPERTPRRPAAVVGIVAAVAIALGWWVHAASPFELTRRHAPAPAPLASPPGEVHSVLHDKAHPLSLAPLEGTARVRRESFEYGEMTPPIQAIGWRMVNRCPAPLDSSATVTASVEAWDVEAPDGSVVSLAQRSVPGWRCEGAEPIDGWEHADPACRWERPAHVLGGDDDLGRPAPEQSWLTLRMGPEGRATCRWVSPGWERGVQLQVGALLLMVGFGVGAWRERRGAASSPDPDL